MSQLARSLEKRIQELTSSIEAQKIELAAYQAVLHMELSKGNAHPESVTAMPPEVARAISDHKKASVAASVSRPAVAALTGNKTTLVSEIVRSYGSAGATPKDVDAYFLAKGITHSKNLIYNTLSYLVSQKKLNRHDGKYFAVAGAAAPPPDRKTAAKKTATPTRHRLSPEGLKRIKEGLRKRWAARKAAQAAAARKK